MFVEKVSLLLCLISRSLLRCDAANSPNPSFGANKDTAYAEECVCIPQSSWQKSLLPLLDPKVGLERVVVYFYRDLLKNEIKMFTPSPEKQFNIPDLAFGEGDDILTISTKTGVDANNSDRNKIRINSNSYNNVDSSTAHIPIGMNIDTILGENITPENINKEEVQIKMKPNDVSIDDSRINFGSDIKTQNPDMKLPVLEEAFPDDGNSLNAKSKVSILNHHNLAEDFERNVLSENIVSAINTESLFANAHSEKKINRSTVFNYGSEFDGNTYITFDKWFGDQMENVHHLKDTRQKNAVDVSTLKLLVEETLHENNINVMPGGLLADSSGAILDVHNLRLRPILIGNSVKYENLMNHKASKFTIPKKAPYLEALIVTIINPPKILGIIPLGKTYLPKEISNLVANRRKTHNSDNISDTTVNTDGRRIIPGKLQVPQKASMPRSINHLALKQNIHSNEDIPDKFKQNSFIIEKPTVTESHLESNSANSRKMPELSDILFNLYKFLHGRRSDEVNEKTLNNMHSDEDKDSAEEEGEKPDFRIIGGNAATSSGTPVSNKGRSGIINI